LKPKELISIWFEKSPSWLKQGVTATATYWNKLWSFSLFNHRQFKGLSTWKKMLSIGYTLVLCVFFFLVSLETNFLWLYGKMPGINDVRNPPMPLVSEVYTADGVLMGTYYVEKRSPVTFEEIDSNTVNALVATEDVRFYLHHGLDIYGILSAAASTVSGSKRGGSTITNQLAKNLYNTRGHRKGGILGFIPGVRTLIAKIKEWSTAFKLEFFFSKQEILTFYFNTVSYGNNAYGIKSAAEYYFSKEPKNLSIEESALLVGILKGTSYYNPKNHPDRAKERRNVVLSQMNKYGFLDTARTDVLYNKPLRLKITEIVKDDGLAPYFRMTLAKELKSWCDENDINLYRDGLRITTTINSKAQKYAERSVAENMFQIQSNFNASLGGKFWFDVEIEKQRKGLKAGELCALEKELIRHAKNSVRYKTSIANGVSEGDALASMYQKSKTEIFLGGKKVNKTMTPMDSIKFEMQQMHCGLVSIKPKTGEVIAWVGGVNWDFFKYDHVWQSRRQPGSSFKPIVYAAALENGMEACSTVDDIPLKYETIIDGEPEIWEPKNSNRRYTYGPVSLRKALAQSINTIAVQLTEKVGPRRVIKLANQMGISGELVNDLSISLGTADVSLFEMVQAYGVFVNDGKLKKTRWINTIEDSEGNMLEDYREDIKEVRVLSDINAYTMTYFLRGGVEEPGGTSRGLYRYGICANNEIGGKTGTSNDYADGWFICVMHDLVTGAWVGGRDMRIHFKGANGQGSKTGLPLVARYLELALNDPKSGVTRGKFEKPNVYNVNLSCYAYKPKVDFLDSLDNPMDSANVDKIHIDFTEVDEIEEEQEEK